MNKVILIGRNIRDIELKQTTAGISVAEFSVAVRRLFKNSNGESDSDFFNCLVYNKLAETISRYVKRGDMIGIEGRLQTISYTNREGNKVYYTKIIVENCEFLQSKRPEEPRQTEPMFEELDPFNNDDLPWG